MGRLLRRRHRTRDERGAVAVEAALVFPVLMVLVFGMIEMSFALRDYASVSSLSRAGARVAATGAGQGPGVCPTYVGAPTCTPASAPALAQQAADAVQRSGSAMPSNQIRFMLVYKANDAGMPGTMASNAAMPETCGGMADCVRFVWVPTQNAFRYHSGAWRSSTISACFPGSAASPMDRVGIYVNARHDMLTGLFGSGLNMGDRAVMNFEPLPTGSCNGSGAAAGGHQ